MRVIEEKSTLVQTSELRTRLDEILRQVGSTRLILEKHHKPVAVLVDPSDFDLMEQALEEYSDLLLALEAKARWKKSRRKDYVSLEAVEKRFLK